MQTRHPSPEQIARAQAHQLELERLEVAGYLPQTDNIDCSAMFHLDCGGLIARGYEETHDRVCPANGTQQRTSERLVPRLTT